MAKPASGATLDTGHALATNLLAVWAFLEGTGTIVEDLAGTNDLTLNGSTSWANDDFGDTAFATTTALAAPAVPATPIVFNGTTSWSIAFRASQSASNNLGVVFGDNTDTVDYVHFQGGTRLRYRNSTSVTIDYALTSFSADDDYVLTFTWSSGSTGVYRLYKNGVLVSTSSTVDGSLTINTVANGYTSNTFSLVGTISYLYVWSGRALTLAETQALDTDPYDFITAAGTDSVTLSTLTKFWQRTGSSVSMPISGTWGGSTASAIQVKVFLASDDSTVVNWTEVASSLTGSSWSGSISVPAGGAYYLQARTVDSGGSSLAVSTDSVDLYVGDFIVTTGQSNAAGRGLSAQTYARSIPALMIDETGTFASLADPSSTDGSTGSFRPLLANLITASTGYPVCFLTQALGGQAIAAWDNGGSGAQWNGLATRVSGFNPNSVACVLWAQGETDAINSMAQATYQAAESAFAADVAATFAGAPKIISTLLAEGSTASGAQLDEINKAKIALWDSGTTIPGPWPMPINLSSDGLHYRTNAELAEWSALCFLAIQDHLFGGSNGRGPRVVSVTNQSGSSTVVVTFNRDLNTSDTSYTSTCFTCTNTGGTARTVTGATRTGARTVAVTLDGPPDGTSPTLTYGNGETLSGSTVVRSTAIALPYTNHSISSQSLYAEPFYDTAVVVSSDATAPTLLTAVIGASGTTLTLTFTEADSQPILPVGAITGFTLSASGGAVTLPAGSRTANTTLVFALSRRILQSETVTISYSGGNVSDSASNALGTITDQSVTNNSTQSSGSGVAFNRSFSPLASW